MRALLLHLALIAFASAPAVAQQTRGGSGGLPPRDEWQRVPDILAAMGPIEGRRVADIAAGQGYLTKYVSRKVGPNGRVFAVEIGEIELGALAKLVRDSSLSNVEVVAGTETDPRISRLIDAAVVLNSYHEFARYEAMLASIRRALKPGGLLVLVDNKAFQTEQTRDYQASHHGLMPGHVEAELRAAGFEIVERRDDFIVQPFPQWLFVARRPMP